MQICVTCDREFPSYPVVDGVKLNLQGRKHCTECKPLRHLTRPRKPVVRARATKLCEACGRPFPAKAVIDGEMRHLYRRRFCLECSPFGAHNTSKTPVSIASAEERAEYRRRKRNEKTYRFQKKQRRERKRLLVDAGGGHCVDCGYVGPVAVFEFHHRDPSTKLVEIGQFNGSLARLLDEVRKCDLLCANCHRLRHVAIDSARPADGVVLHRRRRKLRAILYMGSTCYACGRDGAAPIFEFHHWDAAEKDFGLSAHGIPRRWESVVAELAKCVMLCANCHREVHAGVRELEKGRPGLAEDAVAYAA